MTISLSNLSRIFPSQVMPLIQQILLFQLKILALNVTTRISSFFHCHILSGILRFLPVCPKFHVLFSNKKLNIFHPFFLFQYFLYFPKQVLSLFIRQHCSCFLQVCGLLDLPFLLLILSKFCMFLKTKFQYNHLSATSLVIPSKNQLTLWEHRTKSLEGRRRGEWKTQNILLFMLFTHVQNSSCGYHSLLCSETKVIDLSR